MTNHTNLIERLNTNSGCDNLHCGDSSRCWNCDGCRQKSAADKLSTLTAEVEGLREALREIEALCHSSTRQRLLRIATAALTKGKGIKPRWEHVLEDGSLDHEWVTEFGATFCKHCEAPKPEAG